MIKLKNLYQRISLASLFVLVMAITGCSDDLHWNNGIGDLGEKVRGTLSVPFSASNPVVVTRAVDFSQDAQVKIDSYWIGIFDTVTGELIGTKSDDHPRKEDGTRYTTRNGFYPFAVEDIEIWYYTNNPEAYIVGVINYNDVDAKFVGESSTKPLGDILKGIESFNKIKDISIDTKSADDANRDKGSDWSCPLMFGFYKTNTSATHVTINPDGTPSQNEAKIRLVKTDDNNSDMELPSGAVYLHRMMAEMNYEVIPHEGVTIHSLEYMVVNNPVDIFLAEHTTDQQGGTTNDKDTYLSRTANSADFSDEGYFSVPYQTAKTADNSYVFSYQAYENKHWGRKWSFPEYYDQNDHLVRETRYDDKEAPNGKSDVFRTLCQYADAPFNNKASYVIIKAVISVEESSIAYSSTIKDTDHAIVYYTIHEGATSRPDGTINNAESRGYDYQRIRNTQYNYIVDIYGVDLVKVNAKMSDYHNDGIAGEAWNTEIMQLSEENEGDLGFVITFNSQEEFDMMTWRMFVKTPEGEINYGNWSKPENSPANFPAWPYLSDTKLNNTEVPEPHASEVLIAPYYNSSGSYYIGDFIPLKEFNSKDQPNLSYPASFLITLNTMTGITDIEHIEQYKRGFYISLNKPIIDDDGCTQPYRVVGWEQKAIDKRIPFNMQLVAQSQDYFDIGIPEMSSDYFSDAINGYVYRFSPYFRRDYSRPGGYYQNACNWTGTKDTGAYILFYDNYGYRSDFKVEIMDPSGSYVEATLNGTNEDNCIYNGHDAVYLFKVEGADLQKLSEGYHNVRVTAYPDPSRYTPGDEPFVFVNALHILNEAKYPFTKIFPSETTWNTSFVKWFNFGLTNGDSAYRVLEYGGLTVVGGRKFFASNSYIQTGRPGFPYSASDSRNKANNKGGYFMVSSYRSGTFKVSARHTGSSNRNLYLYHPNIQYGYSVYPSRVNVVYGSYSDDINDYTLLDTTPVTPGSSFVIYELHTGNVNEITDFMICAEENVYIESIEFIPD